MKMYKSTQQKTKQILMYSGLVSALLLAGCQKDTEEPKQTTASSVMASDPAQNIPEVAPMIQSKTIPVKLPQKISCEADDCTEYQVSTVQTNVPWINDYFDMRIRKDVPLAFKRNLKDKDGASEVEPSKQVNSNTYAIGYLGQNNNLGTFLLASSTYSVGAAHGMYHREYIVFDLEQKKRVMVSDLFKPEDQAKVLNALYQANQNWLEEHGITSDKLQATDNFYYSPKGIVFVYPLYELGSYAEGMPELTLPFNMAQGLIKPEYLPK